MTSKKQHGFATIEIVVVVVILVLITGFAIWRIQSSKQDSEQKNLISGSLTTEDRERLEANTSTADAASPADNSPSSTPAPSSPSNPNPSNANTSAGQQNQSQNTNTSTSTTQTTTPPPASTPPAVSNNRPTAEFCKQKDGDSFTNAWVTDNSSHTYQIWENGGWVSKTETGTAARNYDTMQVVGVIPYHTRAAWAICNDKAGYIMFYYKPGGSVYTYNWLVPFEHITLVQP